MWVISSFIKVTIFLVLWEHLLFLMKSQYINLVLNNINIGETKINSLSIMLDKINPFGQL